MICRGCGEANPAGARFCNACGAEIAGRASPSQSASRPESARSPRAYTPKHLAEKILASKSALEGERKQVTVLFADVKGSLELAESVDAEEWHRLLERFFAILTEGVHRFEGTVNQYTGDGIMALFGAPIAHEDHAQRACYAALHLRTELRRYADEIRTSRGLSFATRVGLNSGEVIVGKIGDDLRMDYTAQGHTVGLAQRMESLAAPGTVLLAESTSRLVRDYFELRDLGPAAIRGAAAPVGVFELVDAGALRTRFDVSRARGLSRFVGRSDEMAALEAALERAIAGQGGVVGIVAVAGTGKSRLCFEFAQRCRARGNAVLTAHAVSHGRNVPFLPVLELLRGLFEVSKRDTAQTTRNKIAGAALLLDRALESELPLLFDLLSVSDPERPSGAIAADERNRRLLAVVRRLIEARSKREPGVILIEDLHWIDASTEAFIASAVETTAHTRTLLLLNFRPEYHAPWMVRAHYEQIPLLPLSAQGVRELARDLLGPDPSVVGLAERILERTGGNPFFVEEIVRALAESGALAGSRGAHRLMRAIDALELPVTVQALLAARVDRLGEREKSVLSAASVIGLRFAEPLLREAVALSEAELAEALRVLVAAELVYEEALYPVHELAFTHPLTQEVAYRSQLSDTRARLHRAVAHALEAAHAAAPDEHAALLSHHHEQAGDALAAARAADRAARWSMTRGVEESRNQWERVRTLLEGVEPSTETRTLKLGSLIGLLDSPTWLTTEEGLAAFEEGRALANELRDPVVLTRLRAAYGRILSFQGKTADAIEWARAAVRDADDTTDAPAQVMSRASLAILLGNCGQLQAALAMNEEARARQGALSGSSAPSGIMGLVFVDAIYWYRGTVLSRLGRLDEASATFERALQAAQAFDRPEHSLYFSGMAQVAWLRGDADAMAAQLARASNVLETQLGGLMTDRQSFLGTSMWRGVARALAGDLEHAAEPIETSLAEWRESRALYWQTLGLTRLAEVRLAQGDSARAAAHVDEAVALARRGSYEIWLLDALLVRARVWRCVDGERARDAVERELAEVEVLLQRTGARSYAPRLHLERAALAGLRGDEPAWRGELLRAQAIYREIGAPGQAERLERELAK